MELIDKIKILFEKRRRCYGASRIHAELVELGERVSRSGKQNLLIIKLIIIFGFMKNHLQNHTCHFFMTE
ncbi:MAG: hypothetical protein JWM09_255 [Francisellaceae bacterium]|nr:hypothetical protein [Francisellaceae bacterium]